LFRLDLCVFAALREIFLGRKVASQKAMNGRK